MSISFAFSFLFCLSDEVVDDDELEEVEPGPFEALLCTVGGVPLCAVSGVLTVCSDPLSVIRQAAAVGVLLTGVF
jgi:hypothetical protein